MNILNKNSELEDESQMDSRDDAMLRATRFLVHNDVRRSALVFSIALIFLCIGVALGLNSWPAQQLFSAVASPSLSGAAKLFEGYALFFIGIFWGSKPNVISQRNLLFAWPVVAIIIWAVLHDKIKLGLFSDAEFSYVALLSISMGLPALTSLIWRIFISTSRTESDSFVESNLRWLLLLLLMFSVVPRSALDLTVALHPRTFDLYALKFDSIAGWGIAPWLNRTVESIPAAHELLNLAYGLTPLGLFAVSVKQLSGKKAHVPTALLLWVALTLCALIAYHFFPITGPKYVFGADHYVSKLGEPDSIPLEMSLGVGPNPRNGMPSMHFGWMLVASILWIQSQTALWSRLVLLSMTALVAIATLYLGEHYVIDLIVAVPFCLASIALTTTAVSFSKPERWRTVALGFGCWLAWVILLRTQITFFLEHAWACWLLTFITAIVVSIQAYAIRQFRNLVNIELPIPELPSKKEVTGFQGLELRMGAMFFASGLAALIYQVLFAKELALVFGSTSAATFTVLATFLGGMAIGSLLGGLLAGRIKRPIVAYAFVELAIAGYCVLTPTIFSGLQDAYIYIAADIPPGAPVLLALRFALGALVLLVPTVLMGITLPLLAQSLSASTAQLGKSVAWLYAWNTAGAAFGALATSYVVIPLIGAHSTTLVAALMNLLVALAALELAKTYIAVPDQPLGRTTSSDATLSFLTKPVGGLKVLLCAWLALGLGGILSLGLEVVYVHMLSIVAGNSVYAFGLMLATFLVGLTIGGESGRQILLRPSLDRMAWLAWAQLGLSLSVALGAWSWDMIPAYFGSFAGYPLVTSFQSREAVRALVCALVMIPPTIFIGMSYTLAMDLATTATARRGITVLGWSAALNTLGNIVGVVLFGFWLLPAWGGLMSSKFVALGAVCIAAVVSGTIAAPRLRRNAAWVSVGVGTLIFMGPTSLNYENLSSGANVYFMPQNWGTVVDHAESIDGGLTTVTRHTVNDSVVTTLLTNGKFQGNDAKNGEVQAQVGFAVLPILHQQRRDNALLIGYGTGATSRVLHDAGFSHIDIAELSKDVVKLADMHFAEINKQVSSLPGVQTHITDGRNFLLLTKRQYDVISIEITSIWFAGAASLYNREFYQLTRAKLRKDGVLQQWVQLHHMSPTDLLTIIGTIRSEFDYVSLYVVGGQGILIASNDKKASQTTPESFASLDADMQLQSVRELAGRSFSDIGRDLLLAPAQVDKLLNTVGISPLLWISTDNNLRLEYSTPKANAAPPDRSFEINMKLLKSVNVEN